jgi:hypothetical protein
MSTFKKLLVTLALLFGVAACSTTGGTPVKTMTDAAFVKLSSVKQQAYVEMMNSLPAMLDTKRDSEFRTGMPLYIGDGETGYTMQCQRLPMQTFSTVGFYPGHNPPGWSGKVTDAFAVLYADRNCVIKTQTGDKGQISAESMFMNISTADDVRQLIATLGVQAATTLGSTWLASEGQCGKNCGTQISLDNSAASRSASDSVAVTETDTGVNVVTEVGDTCGTGCAASIPTE